MNGVETEVVVALTPPNRGDDQKGGACRREQARMGWSALLRTASLARRAVSRPNTAGENDWWPDAASAPRLAWRGFQACDMRPEGGG